MVGMSMRCNARKSCETLTLFLCFESEVSRPQFDRTVKPDLHLLFTVELPCYTIAISISIATLATIHSPLKKGDL